MTITPERRIHPRQQAEIRVTVHKNGEKFPATLVDMSEGGVALICERGMFPGTEVNITVNYIEDYSIRGIVKWTQCVDIGPENLLYRIGVAAERILATEDIL
ncbi:MAG: PilZ domain-containing protein [Thermodesulfobacteriota bacterium]